MNEWIVKGIMYASNFLEVQVKSQVFWPLGKSSQVPSQLAIAQVQVKSQVISTPVKSSHKSSQVKSSHK